MTVIIKNKEYRVAFIKVYNKYSYLKAVSFVLSLIYYGLLPCLYRVWWTIDGIVQRYLQKTQRFINILNRYFNLLFFILEI